MKKWILMLFAVLAAGTCLAGQGRLIVTLKDGMGSGNRQAVARAHGLTMVHDLPIINGMVVHSAMPEKAKGALGRDRRIARVENDARVKAVKKPADKPGKPGGGDEDPPPPPQEVPWGIERVGATQVWATTTGYGIKVAVVDTGIDYRHPDLAANYMGGINILNSRKAPLDDNGHGTWCAGMIAAANNELGVVGVAPEASLYAVKVLDRRGSGWMSDVIAGIQWCVANGMQIISMSLGGNGSVEALRDACDSAYSAGILLVAAAGNDGDGDAETGEVDYPGAYGSVMAVAATDSGDGHPWWSSDGTEVEIAAPGTHVNSTAKGGGYTSGDGTSAACPHVSGAAALLMSGSPALSAAEVRQELQDTAGDLGAEGRDAFFGFGIVNAAAACGL